MSNQCSNLFNNRYFNLFNTPLKPYNGLPSIFQFRHNRVLINRKSRSGSSYLRPPIAVRSSSSDIVIIATTVNQDGSLVFQFGDASEVVEREEIVKEDEVVETEEIVKKDDVVEEIERRVEGESNVVKVFDGDQVREVIVKTIERGYVSVGARLTDVGNGISNADIVSDVAESETNVVIDLRDYQAESSEGISDNFMEEVLLPESDPEMNDSLESVESTAKTEFTDQLDGDESSDPTLFLLDDTPAIDKGEDREGTLLTDGDNETEDPSVSLKLESSQVSPVEVMDDEEPYAKGELDQVEAEDASGNDAIDLVSPVSMDISGVELAEATNEVVEEELQDTIIEASLIDEMVPLDLVTYELADDEKEVVEEELQDMNIKGGTLTNELLPSEPLTAEITDAENEVVEEELQGMNTTESALRIEIPPLTDTANEVVEEEFQDMSITVAALKSEMLPSDPLTSELVDYENEVLEEELQDMNINGGTLIDEMVPSNPLTAELKEAENKAVEEELRDMNTAEAALISDLSPTDPSDVELMDTANEVEEEELQDVNITESALISEMLPSDPLTVELEDAENDVVEEELQDMKFFEGILIDEIPPSNPLGVEPTLDEASQLQSVHDKVETTMEDLSTKAKDQSTEDELQQVSHINIEENDVANVIPVSHIEEMEPIVEEEVSEPQSTPLELEPTMQVSEPIVDKEVSDPKSTPQDLEPTMQVLEPIVEERVSQPQSTPFELKPPMQVSDIELKDTTGNNLDDGILQVKDESEDPSVSLKLETNQVSHIEDMDVTLPNVEDELQKVETEDLPPPTMKVSDIELEDTIGQNLDDENFQVTSDSEDPSVSVKLEIMQVSDIEEIDVTQQYAEDELHNVETEDISEGDTEDLLTPATMHISDVELTVSANETMEDRSQDMNISEGKLIDEMPLSDPLVAEPTLDEVSQLQSSDIKLEANSEVLNTESMDVKDRDVEDELQHMSVDNGAENDAVNVMPSEPILEEEVSQPQSTLVEDKPTIQVSDIEDKDATGQNLEDEILLVIDDVASDSFIKDAGQSSYQLEAQLVQDEVVTQNIVEECTETDALGSSILLTESEHYPLLEEERTKDNVSSSELAEASKEMDLLLAAVAEIEREDIYLTGDFLSSGAALLEHPNKALTGGDDACFVAGSKWLGVANGVSQWSFEGTDPGAYAQELMRTCEKIVLDTSTVPVTNPVELLCKGVKETSMSGSSNVLIAKFDGQELHVANIGDTGFLIIRHGAIYKKSSPLLHEFHFALQVEDSDDPLQLVEEHTIELEEGDIIVSATDGLFDNLYEREIAMIVSKSLQVGMKPQEIANALATRAQEVGKSSYVRSPFSDAAQAAGYTGYAGGKPDNVAVIVSLVEKSSNFVTE